MLELPNAIQARVTALSEQGDKLASQAKYKEAVVSYLEALGLLPEPKTQWEACTWLLAAIGDANFLGRHYEQARTAPRAYMGGGKDIFAAENPKYFEFLKTVLKLNRPGF